MNAEHHRFEWSAINASNDGGDLIEGGRLFQTLAAVTQNERSLMVARLFLGTDSEDDDDNDDNDDRSRRREKTSVTRCRWLLVNSRTNQIAD